MRPSGHRLPRPVYLAKSLGRKLAADAIWVPESDEPLLVLVRVRVLLVETPLGASDDAVISLGIDDLDPGQAARGFGGQLGQHELGECVQAGGDVVVHDWAVEPREALEGVLESLPHGADEFGEVLFSDGFDAVALRWRGHVWWTRDG